MREKRDAVDPETETFQGIGIVLFLKLDVEYSVVYFSILIIIDTYYFENMKYFIMKNIS